MSRMRIGLAIRLDDKLEENLVAAKGMGFDNCQLALWNMEYLNEEHALGTKKLLEKHRLEMTGLWCGWHQPAVWDFRDGPSTLGIVPPEYRFSRMQNLLKGAEYARVLGVRDVITHLGFIPVNPIDPNYAAVIQTLRHIANELKAHNQRFLFETGQETPIVVRRTIEDVGFENLGVNYDPANLMMYGNGNAIDGLEVLSDYICSVHAKDGSYPTSGYTLGEEYPVGKGKVDFPKLIKRLKEIGYNGVLSIENERTISEEQRENEISDSRQYLLKLLAE